MKQKFTNIGKRIWPALVLNSANRKSESEFKKYFDKVINKEEYEKLVQDWVKKLDDSKKDVFKEIVTDIFNTELFRKQTLENKAISLLTAVGFAVSLISVILAIGSRSLAIEGLLLYPIMFSFLASMVYFVSSGYYAIKASKVGAWFLPTLGVLSNVSDKEKPDMQWIARKISNVSINSSMMLIRFNFLSVAQDLFKNSLYVLAFTLLLIVLNFTQLIPFHPSQYTTPLFP